MNAKKAKLLLLVHPGEILKEEFLNPLGASEYKLSKAIAVPPRRITKSCTGCVPSLRIPPGVWASSFA